MTTLYGQKVGEFGWFYPKSMIDEKIWVFSKEISAVGSVHGEVKLLEEFEAWVTNGICKRERKSSRVREKNNEKNNKKNNERKRR